MHDYTLTEEQNKTRQANHISMDVFKSRIRKNWSKDRAITQKVHRPNVVDRKLKQELMRNGVTVNVYHTRLQNDWSYHDAIHTRPKGRNVVFTYLTKEEIEFLIQNDLTFDDYKNRKFNGWSHEESIFIPKNVNRFDIYEHDIYPLTKSEVYKIFRNGSTIDTYRMNRAIGLSKEDAMRKPKRT